MKNRLAAVTALALLLGAAATAPAQAAPKPRPAGHETVEKRAPKVVRGVSRLLTRDVLQPDGTTRDETRRVLELPNGRWLDLHVPEKVGLSLNAPVELTGVGGDKTLDVSSVRHLRGNEAKTAYPIAQADGGATIAAAAGQPSTGTTSVLVILAQWAGNLKDSVTPTSAANVTFTQGNPWWKEVSYGALQITGRVTDWVKISPPSGDCYSYSDQIMSRAKTAAASYNPGSYQRVVVYFPNCGGSPGWAYVGAGSVWINGSMDQRVMIHEQGHNYGLGHAHSYPCSGGTLGGSCSVDEYGDPYDAMGGGSHVGHFSGRHKDMLGWLGSARRVTMTSGSPVTLTPFETANGIKAGIIGTAVSTRKYWVEYRTAQGKDKTFPAGAAGVQVRLVSAAIGDGGPLLLDTRPGGPAYEAFDTITIPAGSSWTSPENIRISVGAVSSSGAVVTALNNAPPPAAPEEPTQVKAVVGDTRATVSWKAPVTDNGAPISSYVIYANPGPRYLVVTTPGGVTTTSSFGGLTNGTSYTFTVVARNSAGDSVASAPSNAVVPALALPSISITSPPSGTSTARDTLPVTVTATSSPISNEPIESVDYLVDGEEIGYAFSAPFSTTLDLNRLTPGAHMLVARATDQNRRAKDSSPVAFTYAPPAPTVAITSPATGSTLTGTTAEVVLRAVPGSSGHPIENVYATLADGTNVGYADPEGNDTYRIQWYLDQLVNGQSYVVTAYATDDTGRTTASAPVTLTVQHPAPTVVLTSPAAGSQVRASGEVVAQVGKAAPGDPELQSVQLVADDVTLLGTLYAGEAGAEPSGLWTIPVDWRSLANGTHTLRAKALNDLGYGATSTALVVEVANPVPSAVIVAPSGDTPLTGEVTVTVNAVPDGAPVTDVAFFAAGDQIGSLSPTGNANEWAATWPTQYRDPGPVDIAVQVTDEAGYRGVSATRSVVLDNPGPTVAVASPAAGATLTGVVTVTATTAPRPGGPEISYVDYQIDGVTYASASVSEDATWPAQLDLTYVPPGAHVLRARVADNEGLTRTSAEVPISVVSPPDPPSSLSVVYGTDTVDLSWEEPLSDGGSPVTGYLVEQITYDPDGMPIPTVKQAIDDPSMRAAHLAGLTTNLVELRVRSVSSAGKLEYGAQVSVDLLPAPPTGLTVTPGAGSLAVSWTASTASDLTGYEVFVQEGTSVPDTTGFTETTTTGTSATLTGLKDGTSYTVVVLARDQAYGATPSSAVTAATLGRTTLVAAAPATVLYGGAVNVTGTLKRAGTGAVLAGKALVLQQRKPGTAAWANVGTFTTASNGVATARRVPTAHTEYRWVFTAAGEVTTGSNGRVVKVTPRVSAAFSATRVALGRSVLLSGTVTPNHKGQRVYLQQKVGTSWRNVTSQLLTSSSTYRFTVTGRARGTAYYRVYKPADADHLAAYSPVRALSVA